MNVLVEAFKILGWVLAIIIVSSVIMSAIPVLVRQFKRMLKDLKGDMQ